MCQLSRMHLGMAMRKSLAFFFLMGFSPVNAQDVALLLFDAETHRQFAGCLNCSQFDGGSVCNQFGEFGSIFSEVSIWNQFGKFGSMFESNSPWNQFGEGLIIVDPNGNFYGHFSLNIHAKYGQSRLQIVQYSLQLYEAGLSLDQIRDLLCER